MLTPILAVLKSTWYRGAMLRRLALALGVSALAGLWITAPIACSSSQRRDQYYGTDVGADYQPEAGVFGDASDALDSDDGGDATTSPDGLLRSDTAALPDTLDVPDAPVAPDAPTDSTSELDVATDN